MKRILLTTALILSTAGAAAAMTNPGELSGPARAEAERLVPNGDFDNLTSAQVGAIRSILYGDDSNRGGQIRAVLN
ncbi:hypothetical protein DEA8626_02744 [Defluviimonas aquaemixtae]|uniref:Uncharacterized protein n=1 Tax=Albidovulum aquaemixtae TaxID=1542388 RepID=A0A2R8BK09_9RHOB|nr:hypothetical protein [Defluviimonas aquaemixtae]SPH23678.1 hypothetical protein DEA8626_02744 [Defluviimonas aquaemixtae]